MDFQVWELLGYSSSAPQKPTYMNIWDFQNKIKMTFSWNISSVKKALVTSKHSECVCVMFGDRSNQWEGTVQRSLGSHHGVSGRARAIPKDVFISMWTYIPGISLIWILRASQRKDGSAWALSGWVAPAWWGLRALVHSCLLPSRKDLAGFGGLSGSPTPTSIKLCDLGQVPPFMGPAEVSWPAGWPSWRSALWRWWPNSPPHCPSSPLVLWRLCRRYPSTNDLSYLRKVLRSEWFLGSRSQL